MKNFQPRKNNWRKMLESKPSLVMLAVLVGVFAWSVAGFLGKMQITDQNRLIAEEKVRELKEKKEKLSADIADLETEKGKEENIREKFGLAKEGEGLIVIVDEKNEAKNENDGYAGGFWGFFKNFFK